MERLTLSIAQLSRCAVIAGVLLTVLFAQRGVAQSATGSLQGTVQASQTGSPLAYAVVSIPQLSLERFTDGAGRFLLTALAPGQYTVQVRRIGFAPYRGVVMIEAAVTARLDVQLTPIPVRIQSLTVRALASCATPGVPDSSAQPEVATLVGLLRENADRYRLLASQYPFAYRQVRALVELPDERAPTSPLFLQHVDTVVARSATRVEYKAGQVVKRTRMRGVNSYSMAIPTILDLADDTFARAHCFAYGGKETVDRETWLRLDVRAADRLRSPDVHGTFFLDSATAQLRRMDLELSQPERLPRELQHIGSVQVRTRFMEIAPGLSIINEVCGVNRPKRRGKSEDHRLPGELQILAAYEFEKAPDGVLAFRNMVTPRWLRGELLARSSLWCVESASPP